MANHANRFFSTTKEHAAYIIQRWQSRWQGNTPRPTDNPTDFAVFKEAFDAWYGQYTPNEDQSPLQSSHVRRIIGELVHQGALQPQPALELEKALIQEGHDAIEAHNNLVRMENYAKRLTPDHRRGKGFVLNSKEQIEAFCDELDVVASHYQNELGMKEVSDIIFDASLQLSMKLVVTPATVAELFDHIEFQIAYVRLHDRFDGVMAMARKAIMDCTDNYQPPNQLGLQN